jgi:hypothetical protein
MCSCSLHSSERIFGDQYFDIDFFAIEFGDGQKAGAMIFFSCLSNRDLKEIQGDIADFLALRFGRFTVLLNFFQISFHRALFFQVKTSYRS